MRNFGWIWIVSWGLVACQQTQPQRPAFHGESKEDTAVVQLLSMNQQMATQADMQLARVATSDFVLMDENYWVKGLHPQDANRPALQEGEFVEFEASFYSLQGAQLTIHQASAKIGQVDEIPAVAHVLPLMQHGGHVTLLVPWYMAFGSVGSANVPAYENIRVELSVQ